MFDAEPIGGMVGGVKVLLIGEAPGKTGERIGAGPFDPSTRSGRRLADLAGVADVRDVFGAINLLNRWPGRTAHGSAFPAGQARKQAEQLWQDLPADVDLLLVGSRVATAFQVTAAPLSWLGVVRPFEEVGERPIRGRARNVAIFPHPSPVNRYWNDPSNEVRARRFLRALVRDAA